MDNKKIIKISDYYKDFNIPNEVFDSKSLKNLLELSAANEINIFDKRSKKKIKKKDKILKQCEDMKKIKLKEYTKEIKKFGNNEEIRCDKIKKANEHFFENIESIDSIMNILKNESDDIEKLNHLLNSDDEFIEIFSN